MSIGVGVLCGYREKLNEAVGYFKTGQGMGSIVNAAKTPPGHPAAPGSGFGSFL